MPALSTRIRPALENIAWALAFALAYAQSPLYTSNQNQYFLHGLAQAGVGHLRGDWLANTADPTPVFSMMVQALAAWPWVFYLVYAALMGIYLFSLASIVATTFEVPAGPGRTLLLAALVVAHAAATRALLARLVAPEAEFVLEGGVAGQRLLGAVLQPSAFGVLLVLSLALFLKGRWSRSALSLAAAAAIHPTYLLSAGILVGATVATLGWRRPTRRPAVWLAVLGGVCLGAIAAAVYLGFRPTGADLYARAAEILIRERIPHHAIPEKWIDLTAVAQAAIVIAALWLVRRSRLFPVLLFGTASVIALTAVQVITGDSTLALMFPWRLSVVLVPVSTACVVGAAIVGLTWQKGPHRGIVAAGLAAAALAVLAGVYRFGVERQQERADPAAQVMAFVAGSVGAGDVFLIDPKLQDFRLRTGAPIVVDVKSIPYRDGEVVEWWNRLRLARNFFRDRPEWIDCAILDRARADYVVTHVVLGPEQRGLECPQLSAIYDDGSYAVYRLAGGSPELPGGGVPRAR